MVRQISYIYIYTRRGSQCAARGSGVQRSARNNHVISQSLTKSHSSPTEKFNYDTWWAWQRGINSFCVLTTIQIQGQQPILFAAPPFTCHGPKKWPHVHTAVCCNKLLWRCVSKYWSWPCYKAVLYIFTYIVTGEFARWAIKDVQDQGMVKLTDWNQCCIKSLCQPREWTPITLVNILP